MTIMPRPGQLAVLIAAMLLSACAGKVIPVASNPDVSITQLETLPAPQSSDMLDSNRPYLIGPFDKLSVSVFGVSELQRDVQTDAEAAFSFPLVGRVNAAGKSPFDVAAEIENRLRGRYVREPDVTVNLVESVTQRVTVDGQVARPGQFPVMGKMTLMRAIANAGGLNEFANLEDVLIFRSVSGQQYVGVYNLEGIRRGNYIDPEVFANDVIVVGDSQQRRMFKDILQSAPLLTTPLIILGQQL